MKKTFLIFTLIFLISKCYGQTENVAYKIIAEKFETYYNAEKYDSIFSMFSSEMPNALPSDKTKEFLNGLNSQVGKMTKMQLIFLSRILM